MDKRKNNSVTAGPLVIISGGATDDKPDRIVHKNRRVRRYFVFV